jgi:predicted nuclease of predicted toxin-antitoxin system
LALGLYLDDCACSKHLATLLRQAGHTVFVPGDFDLRGASDAAHLECARQKALVLLTRDADDFEELHRQQPGHPGILAICQDSDVERDMSDAEIVEAIAFLESTYQSASAPIVGGFHVLNPWRRPAAVPKPKGKGRGKKA